MTRQRSRTSVRLTVDLDALAGNYRRLAATADAGVCGAVVKADGYGLGAAAVGPALAAAGCRNFFVATASEGAQLLDALTAVPSVRVFVLDGAPWPEDRTCCRARGLVPILNSEHQLDDWRTHGGGPWALHVDTGMARLGVPWQAPPVLGSVDDLVLLLTHLACGDDPDNPFNRVQIERFETVKRQLPGVPTSIGHSAGLLLGAPYQGDLPRPGIALYGGSPWADRGGALAQVATLEARVLQLRSVAAGDAVGYGSTYVASKARTLAVCGLGYADGLPRGLSNCGAGWFKGCSLPIVGRVSMDLTTIDATDIDATDGALAVGDWVQFLGPEVPLETLAGQLGCIGYEILTGLAVLPRRYAESGRYSVENAATGQRSG